MERVCDELLLPVMTPMGELEVQFPDQASLPVVNQDGGRLYLCDDYTLTVQTMESGDLNKTLQTLCGYAQKDLTVMKTLEGGLKRWDFVWSSAGEGATQVGRGAVLDDGNYHYCLTAMADEALSGSLDPQWDEIFASMTVHD